MRCSSDSVGNVGGGVGGGSVGGVVSGVGGVGVIVLAV